MKETIAVRGHDDVAAREHAEEVRGGPKPINEISVVARARVPAAGVIVDEDDAVGPPGPARAAARARSRSARTLGSWSAPLALHGSFTETPSEGSSLLMKTKAVPRTLMARWPQWKSS